MTTFKAEANPCAIGVAFDDDNMNVSLRDGRTLSVPLDWFASLRTASNDQLANYELLGDGEGIHWPDLDEDLSIKGLLEGVHRT